MARYLPAIHDFDEANSVLIMDFMGQHTVLFEQLFATGHIARGACEGLAEYLALVTARTLSPVGGDPASAARAVVRTRRCCDFLECQLPRSLQMVHPALKDE